MTDATGRRRRALVTNDDGIASPGLHRLARAAVDAGLDVVVAAPRTDSSGASAGLSAVESEGRVVVERHELPGLAGVPAYGVAALPGFIALIATRGAFGDPPDLVLSGINRGLNTGHAILHSGTVGAVLTGATNGCAGLAVSIDVLRGDLPVVSPAQRPHGEQGRPGPRGDLHWETAGRLAQRVLEVLLALDEPRVLNLNVPNLALDRVRGVRTARLASFGAVQTNIAEAGEGYVRLTISEIDAELEPGTDAALVAEGWASVTALQPLCEADVVLPGLDDDGALTLAPSGGGQDHPTG